MSADRPGLLRQSSSYGPPLDVSHTFNDGDPVQNARRNSRSASMIPSLLVPSLVTPSRSYNAAPQTTKQWQRGRRVSFSNVSDSSSSSSSDGTGSSPSTTPSSVSADDSPSRPAHQRRATPRYPDPVSSVPPRNGSDPGPTSGSGSLFQHAQAMKDKLTGGMRSRARSVSVPARPTGRRSRSRQDEEDAQRDPASIELAPQPPSDDFSGVINKGIELIAKLVPEEMHGLHTVHRPADKIFAQIDVVALQQRLHESAQMSLSANSALRTPSAHVHQTPLRLLYDDATVPINCGIYFLHVPFYLSFTARQIVKRKTELGPEQLGTSHLKSNYFNLIAELDRRDTKKRNIHHTCDVAQLCQALHHFLSGLPEAPLEPTLFRVLHECCFLASRGDDPRVGATAGVRALTGGLSQGEVNRIKIARLAFCMMPKAHSDTLEYLLIFFTSLMRGPITPKDIAESFGWDVCAPRDAVHFMTSIGMVPTLHDSASRAPLTIKEASDREVQKRATQVLWWLVCYWSQILGWREDLASLDQPSTGVAQQCTDATPVAQLIAAKDRQITELAEQLAALKAQVAS